MRYYLYNVDTQKIQQSASVKENGDNTLVDESGDIYKILNRQKKMNIIKYNVQLQERCQVGGMKTTSITESYQKFLNSLPEEDRQGFIDLLTGQPDIDKDIMTSNFVNPLIREKFIASGVKESRAVEDITVLFDENKENNVDYTQISDAQRKITEKYFKMSPEDLNDLKNKSLITQYQQIKDSDTNDLFDENPDNNDKPIPQETIVDEYDMDGNIIEQEVRQPVPVSNLEGAKRKKPKRKLYDQLYNFKVSLNDNFLASGRDVFNIKLQRIRQKYSEEDQEKLSYFYRQKSKMLHCSEKNCLCDQQPLPDGQVQKYSGGNNPVEQPEILQEQQNMDVDPDNENSMSTIASDPSSNSEESSQEGDSTTTESPESDNSGISQGIDPEFNGGKKKPRKRNYLPSEDSDGVEYY